MTFSKPYMLVTDPVTLFESDQGTSTHQNPVSTRVRAGKNLKGHYEDSCYFNKSLYGIPAGCGDCKPEAAYFQLIVILRSVF